MGIDRFVFFLIYDMMVMMVAVMTMTTMMIAMMIRRWVQVLRPDIVFKFFFGLVMDLWVVYTRWNHSVDSIPSQFVSLSITWSLHLTLR